MYGKYAEAEPLLSNTIEGRRRANGASLHVVQDEQPGVALPGPRHYAEGLPIPSGKALNSQEKTSLDAWEHDTGGLGRYLRISSLVPRGQPWVVKESYSKEQP